jgi:outer membrane protein assembly factor BamB
MLVPMIALLVGGGSLAAAWQAQQVPAPPIAPVPQVAPKPGPPKKAAPPPPKFPSAVRWSANLDAAPIGPPLVAGGRVVLALRSGVISARQMGDGKDVWTIKLTADQAPVADADKLFVVTGETLHALNGADGSTAWSIDIGQPSAPILARGGWVIAASSGSVTALRASDGEKVWTKATGAVSERAAIDGDAIYLPLSEGHLLALDLKTGNERWDTAIGGAPTEPVAYADRIYLGSASKRLLCLQAKSGREEWHWEIGTRLIGPLAADASNVYFTAMDNVLRALSRSTGGQRWTYRLAYRPTGGPVLMGGQVAVPGITSELIGIDVTSGKVTGKLTFPVDLAIGPSFVAPDGPDGAPAVLAIAGGLTTQWTLSASMPAADAPATVPK